MPSQGVHLTPRKRLAAAIKEAVKGDGGCDFDEAKELRDAWAAFKADEAERHKRLASAVDDAACDLGCAHREESADALRGAWREFEAETGQGSDKADIDIGQDFTSPLRGAMRAFKEVRLVDLKAALLALSDDEFLAIVACRCKHCGSPGEGRCYCQREPERD